MGLIKDIPTCQQLVDEIVQQGGVDGLQVGEVIRIPDSAIHSDDFRSNE